MSRGKNGSYINIQSWMVTNLKLKGNDLLVYAIIYGFSQDEESSFSGSLQYLADWCSSTRKGIQKNLKNLIDRNLIIKNTTKIQGITVCSYYATELSGVQLSCTGC